MRNDILTQVENEYGKIFQTEETEYGRVNVFGSETAELLGRVQAQGNEWQEMRQSTKSLKRQVKEFRVYLVGEEFQLYQKSLSNMI